MSDYVAMLMQASDEGLTQMVSSMPPGSINHESIKFEMSRRAMIAQVKAASATERAAQAAEKYTRATYWFISATVGVGILNLMATMLLR